MLIMMVMPFVFAKGEGFELGGGVLGVLGQT
jgi:hypothetical protein